MIDLYIELWLEWLDMWGVPVIRGREASIPQVWPL